MDNTRPDEGPTDPEPSPPMPSPEPARPVTAERTGSLAGAIVCIVLALALAFAAWKLWPRAAK